MTIDECIKQLESLRAHCEAMFDDKWESDGVWDKDITALDMAIERMKRLAVNGHWVGTADGYADGELVYDMWECSECGHEEETDDPDTLPHYCPDCGAKMNGEE